MSEIFRRETHGDYTIILARLDGQANPFRIIGVNESAGEKWDRVRFLGEFPSLTEASREFFYARLRNGFPPESSKHKDCL